MAPKHIDYIGPHTFDMASLQGKLVDVEKGGLQVYRKELPGFQTMSLALAEAMPLHGAGAGIPQETYDHFVACKQTIAMIDEHLAVAAKQVEVLKESRAYYVDACQNDVALMVDAMRSRASRRRDTAVLVPFEPVIKYHGQTGDKAAQTRRKNEQVKTQAPTPPAPPVMPEAATPPA